MEVKQEEEEDDDDEEEEEEEEEGLEEKKDEAAAPKVSEGAIAGAPVSLPIKVEAAAAKVKKPKRKNLGQVSGVFFWGGGLSCDDFWGVLSTYVHTAPQRHARTARERLEIGEAARAGFTHDAITQRYGKLSRGQVSKYKRRRQLRQRVRFPQRQA